MSDQLAPSQQVAVSVQGHAAGIWLEPLSNPYHRWLDDSFHLPAELTAGESSLSITLTPIAGSPPWSAAAYEALSVVDPFADRQAPSAVTGLVARGNQDNSIALNWQAAQDNVWAPTYQVYGSRTANFTDSRANLLGTTNLTSFTHGNLGLNQTWYYRVRAVGAAGNTGPFSNQASARTGNTERIEAERLLPPVAATAPAMAQGDCCGVQWSGGAQMWFQASRAGDDVTLAFSVPTTGTYDVSLVETKAADYGINTITIDGHGVGSSNDGYNPTVTVTPPIGEGTMPLAAGRHTLTLTVTGRNPAAVGYFAGIDYLSLTLVH